MRPCTANGRHVGTATASVSLARSNRVGFNSAAASSSSAAASWSGARARAAVTSASNAAPTWRAAKPSNPSGGVAALASARAFLLRRNRPLSSMALNRSARSQRSSACAASSALDSRRGEAMS